MGETREAQRLPDAAGGRAAGGLAARRPLIRNLSARLAKDESGATAIEYGLIIAFMFLAIVGGLSVFASNENAMYTRISNTIAGATR
jgi:pilus assembly protein Flp/PilA